MSGGAAQDEPGRGPRFVWPPGGPVSSVGNEPASAASAGPDVDDNTGEDRSWAATVALWCRSAERYWLRPVALPLSRRIEETGWQPDGLDVYCDVCGGDVGPWEADEFGCAACRGSRPPWDRLVRLCRYEEPASGWVREVKFARGHALGLALGGLLGRRLVEAGAPAGGGGGLVVPVPVSRRRRLVRGIDHAGVLAGGVAGALGWRAARVLRGRHRPSQRSVALSRRQGNVRGAFVATRAVRRAAAARGGGDPVPIVIVDDVLTSGATLRAAARAVRAALRLHGIPAGPVWAGVVAVTPAPDRRGDLGGGVDGVGSVRGE